jgi:SAM-dependent methyltransferase
MSDGTSNWIPSSRIRIAIAIALLFAIVAIVGSAITPFALALLVPALGVAAAAFVMLRVRHQLSAGGGGWERRIHDLVVSRLALPPDAHAKLLDIGCGDASLLIALLKQSPHIGATGIDYWGANWDYARSACEARLSGLGLRADFHRMDAAHLEFPDASFDIVVSVMCFHEVRAPRGSKQRGPLLAVSEALRVLKRGGTFILIDRFADTNDYGPPGDLAAVLAATENLHRESIVTTLNIPWPLNSKRALGPVEIISDEAP